MVEDPKVAASAWREVFNSNDPFGWPFEPSIKRGCLFFPTDGLHLTRQQYSALMVAIAAAGEPGFFVSIVESEGLGFLHRSSGHWWLQAPSYEEYSAMNLTLENALYSAHGNWGIVVSHESHAVVGGTAPIVESVSRHYGCSASDYLSLRDQWSGNPNSEWITTLPDFSAE